MLIGARILVLMMMSAMIAIAPPSDVCPTDSMRSTDRNDWDFYLFVHLWPATDCLESRREQCEAGRYPIFTIHGLWPQRCDGTWPQFCRNQRFDPSAVTDLLPDLRQHWPDLYGQGVAFWKHEYEKHGACTDGSEHDYFSDALQLARTYNVTEMLEDSDIMPNTDGQGYRLAEWQDAIQRVTGTKPIIWCRRVQGDTIVIDQILLCIDPRDMKTFQCPPSEHNRNCPRDAPIGYPLYGTKARFTSTSVAVL